MPKKLVFKPNKKLSAENIMYFSHNIRQMDDMKGEEFEDFLRNLFTCFGYTVTPNLIQLPNGFSGDGGIDLIAQKGKNKTAIQAKAWRLEFTKTVGVEVVRGLAGSIVGKRDKRMGGCVITTSFFTPNAIEETRMCFPHIELIDRRKLLETVAILNPNIIAEGVDYVFEKINEHMKKCPKCGHVLTEKENENNGIKFLACPKFPNCKHTEPKSLSEMNRVILVGRLTKDPEIRYLQEPNPMAITRYVLAVNRKYAKQGEQQADFITCTAFGKSAEFAERYFK